MLLPRGTELRTKQSTKKTICQRFAEGFFSLSRLVWLGMELARKSVKNRIVRKHSNVHKLLEQYKFAIAYNFSIALGNGYTIPTVKVKPFK